MQLRSGFQSDTLTNSIAIKLAAFLIMSAVVFFAGCSENKTRQPFTRVETIAGSNGEFGEAFGIAVNAGDVYISDGERGKILKIGVDGAVTDFAVGLDTPSGIAFDDNGELIVADSGTNTIKAVGLNGAVRTIAGVENTSGFADGDAASTLFNGPVGVAVSGDKIFVSDTYNDRIRIIENGRVSTLVGSTRGFSDGVQAQFDTPLGIAVWQNKLLVADAGNRRVRVVEPDGRVWTLAGNGDEELRDGLLASAAFVEPTAIAVNETGRILVADGNAIREIGGRVTPIVETIAAGRRGFRDGNILTSRFNRPSGMAFGESGELLVADSDNRVVRKLASVESAKVNPTGTPKPFTAEEFRNQQPPRWPFDPPDAKRDIAGTLGEIRGEVSQENGAVWFHNGLDIAGAYGETARFIRDEKALAPMAAENFGTSRELLRMPTIGYIHVRLGRDQNDRSFDDDRFQFSRSPDGKISDVRVPRGAKFTAGEPLGTLNAMNHVHMIAGRTGAEMNALAALVLPNVSDTISPTIENTAIFSENWSPIETKPPGARIKLAGKTRVVVRAYDRMDGNPERRKLGVYKLGYQILRSDGSPESNVKWTIEFDRMPSNNAVRFVYADGSRSGATGETIFNYIVTNRVGDDHFSEGFLDAAALPPGNYTIRVFAADFFGNTTSKDIPVEVTR